MKWKTTAALAALMALAGLAYLLYTPEGEAPKNEERLVFPDFRADQVARIEIARPGAPEVALEKVSAAPAAWRVLPADRPADPAVVRAMLDGVGRLAWTGSMEPGRPETAHEITGLGAPRLSVVLSGEGKVGAVRFGNSPPTNQSAVFFEVEGRPRIGLAESDVFDAYNKTAAQVRSRRLAHFDPHRIVRLEVDCRFTRARGKDDHVVEYEKSVLERSDKPPDKGWYLRKPWEERLDDMKVNMFLADLSQLAAEEFLPAADGKATGLDQPQFAAAITPHGAEKPMVVQFGDRARGGGKACLYACVAGSGEAALVDWEKFDRLPRQRGHFRSDAIFLVSPQEVKAISVESALGKVLLEQREVRKKTEEGEDLVTPVWEVLEPKDVKCERDRTERFVANVLIHRITGFLGEQPDLKLFNLEPPELTVAVRGKDGPAHVLHFGMKGEDPGYMKREGLGEIFTVRPELVKLLRKLELNLRAFEMYNVPRESLREFRFEARKGEGVEPVSYALRLDPADGKWRFADKGREREEADADRVDGLLAGLNYIKADAFVTRDPAEAARLRLREGEAAHTLWILAEGGPKEGVALYVSGNLSDRVGTWRYHARFGHSPIVFELNPLLVEALKRAPARKPGQAPRD